MIFEKWATKGVLITVRTYPTPAWQGIEVSCTAGVTEEGTWIRLFPVPYRFLDLDRRFRKYQWVELRATKAVNDSRIESYHPDLDSIRVVSDVLSTAQKWQARKDILRPLMEHCLCCLEAKRQMAAYPTLGLFKPRRIHKLVIEKESDTWSPDQMAKLVQIPLFAKSPATQLEKIPYRFKYEFECDEDSCHGHSLTCTDWELGQSFRRWRDQYGTGWESYFRQRFESEMALKLDTYFYVGTVHQHPASWIVVGLFYPLK